MSTASKPDVPQGAPFQREIEAIYPWITAGCGGNNYCPNGNITRGQMALYLLKGKEGLAYNPPPCTVPIFNDVPCSDRLAPWIDELARRGITPVAARARRSTARTISSPTPRWRSS